MEPKLLIVGIDPGTTIGYAALDLQRNLVVSGSKKNMSFDELLAKLHSYGTIVHLGTDKKKVPVYSR